VIAVHIDNGFMRKNESQRVEQSLEKLGHRLRGSVLVAVMVDTSCNHCVERSSGHFIFLNIWYMYLR
jgi:GMP synthase PP-ATPase subunit